MQGTDVLGRRVVGNSKLSLRLVLVADVAHSQRGCERFVQSAASQLRKRMIRIAEKGATDCRRSTEQQWHKPSATVKVADQREVSFGTERAALLGVSTFDGAPGGPEWTRQREVEVHAGDDLHHSPVAVTETAPVHVLHGAHVRAAVARDGYGAIAGDHAGHARRPQHLVADQRVRELVQVAETAGRFPNTAVRRSHELQQRLGEIRGDGGMGEGGAERLRMRVLGNVARAVDAQTLLLDADPSPCERGWTECLDEIAQASLYDRGQRMISMGADEHRSEGRGFCAISMAIASVGAVSRRRSETRFGVKGKLGQALNRTSGTARGGVGVPSDAIGSIAARHGKWQAPEPMTP